MNTCLECKYCWKNPTNDLSGYWCTRDLPENEKPCFENMGFLGNQEFELEDADMACFEEYISCEQCTLDDMR